jgi:hypothetical protein
LMGNTHAQRARSSAENRLSAVRTLC